MATKVLIPAALRRFTNDTAAIEAAGATVGAVLADVIGRYRPLEAHLFQEKKLRSFVNVFVNEEDIRFLAGLDTPVKAGDTVSIVPSIAGGADEVSGRPVLSPEEMARYSRHLILPEVGIEGQKKLKSAKVLLVGVGGLGSPLGLYLAAAGVGTLGLVDFDVVDASNLQRQLLHGTPDVGRPKLASAMDTLKRINPNVRLVPYETMLTSENAFDILRDYSIVADGTDNFATRYLVNDACVLLGKTNVYGSIFRFEGQSSVFKTPDGPCYRCLYPAPPPPGLVPSCAEGGVLGVLPGIVGAIQAMETIKLILGQGETLVGRLLLFDALGMRYRELKLRKDPNCPLCSEKRTITKLVDYAEFCGITKAAEGKTVREITVADLKRMLDAREEFDLVDVRETFEYQIARIPGARLIPLGTIESKLSELDPKRKIVVHCKAGGRSKKACETLLAKGYANVVNVAGGIDQWSKVIDPSVPRY